MPYTSLKLFVKTMPNNLKLCSPLPGSVGRVLCAVITCIGGVSSSSAVSDILITKSRFYVFFFLSSMYIFNCFDNEHIVYSYLRTSWRSCTLNIGLFISLFILRFHCTCTWQFSFLWGKPYIVSFVNKACLS